MAEASKELQRSGGTSREDQPGASQIGRASKGRPSWRQLPLWAGQGEHSDSGIPVTGEPTPSECTETGSPTRSMSNLLRVLKTFLEILLTLFAIYRLLRDWNRSRSP